MAWLYQAQTATKGIQLGNEEWGHTLAIGNNWTKLRVGIRIAVPYNQSFEGYVPNCFTLGLCRGTAAMYKSPDCAEFLGLILGSSSISSFTYSTSPGPHFFNGRPNIASKVNSTITLHTGLSANYYISALNTVATVAFIDFTKNGGNGTSFTVSAWMAGNSTQATTNNTYAVFMQSMENNTTPTNASSVNGNTTLTHPGQGLLDTIYFGWAKSVPAITLFDICAVRVL